jgi:putative transposase
MNIFIGRFGEHRRMRSGTVTLQRRSSKIGGMKNAKSLYHGYRFPAAVISCAVRW